VNPGPRHTRLEASVAFGAGTLGILPCLGLALQRCACYTLIARGWSHIRMRLNHQRPLVRLQRLEKKMDESAPINVCAHLVVPAPLTRTLQYPSAHADHTALTPLGE
jgi:hypothetical protein